MIKSVSVFVVFILLWLVGFCQSQPLMRVDTTRESVEYWQQWMKDLNEMGVQKTKDSFFVREEVIKLMKDSVYRKSVYPEKYDWPLVVLLLQRMELKKAFWQLINLYETDSAHRNITVGTFILYDSLMDMDKILLNTYYTYAFTDPQCCRIRNNRVEIFRPDILERKLRTTKEIAGYIRAYRKQKNPAKKPD
ncbi:MAG: hypothetical protein HZB42_00610 [Sphingobacteriales bacterium]|nr:hypothetical protein [Sphingobacteriales bacterium]